MFRSNWDLDHEMVVFEDPAAATENEFANFLPQNVVTLCASATM